MSVARLILALAALALAPVCGAQTLAVTLSAPPLELVQDTERFNAFARRLAVEVDRQLGGEPAAETPEAQRKLLGLRAHLALYLGENEIALRTAAKIRAFQSDPAERAHSGLATQALVAARGDAAKLEAEFGAPSRGRYPRRFDSGSREDCRDHGGFAPWGDQRGCCACVCSG